MSVRRAGEPDRQQVILIVDDVPGNRELLKGMLTPEGFLFRSAGSGAEALASIAEQPPDLILLDVMMPDMDGREVVEIIKADATTSHIPVIMVTALDDRKSRLASLDAGAEDFLTKPVDRAELKVRVRNLLRLKALSDHFGNYSQALEGEVRSRTKELLASENALAIQFHAAQRYLDTAEVMLVGLDTRGKITLVNRYACSLLGWPAEELIGCDWAEKCLPPQSREGMRANHAAALSGVSVAMQNEVRCKSGKVLLIEWSGAPMRDDQGVITGTIASGADITTRFNAVRDLEVAEERMRFALVSANVGIWDMDPAGKIRWSDTLEAQYGLPEGGFDGTFEGFMRQVHPDDKEGVIEVLRKAASAGGDFQIQHRIVQPDETVRWMTVAGYYELDDEGNVGRATGISQDVTDRRILERQYQQAQKMEAVGRLAAGVAHDFNNLLTVITGFAEFAASDAPADSQQRKDVAEVIQAADRAAGLTQQLLAFSRQQVLHTAPVDMNELVTGMNAMITRLIGADVNVTLALRPNLRAALADRGQVEQVLMNLVVNARDAMPEGGEILIETAEFELENSPFHEESVVSGLYVMLAVTDSGTGMTKETMARLFEPFYTTKEAGEGTGLGLSTSYGIVKQSNGYIWVYSEAGKGTTFKVFLPISQDAPTPAAPKADAVASAPAATETVLLVEDEHGVRELTVRILRKAGYRVILAANGDEAALLFSRNVDSVDIVVTDVVMPGCGGPELIARLRLQKPGLPVLFTSGYTEQSIAYKAGFHRGIPFLQKPFTAAELRRSVRLTLDGAKSGADGSG